MSRETWINRDEFSGAFDAWNPEGSDSIEDFLESVNFQAPGSRRHCIAIITLMRLDVGWYHGTGEQHETEVGAYALFLPEDDQVTEILGVGRYKRYCKLFPWIKDISEQDYMDLVNDNKDGEDMDLSVSRVHGFVFSGRDAEGRVKVLYRDVGSFYKGTKDGSSVNDQQLVHNQTITWHPQDYIGIGKLIQRNHNPEAKKVSHFRLRQANNNP